ncbi:ubiquitin-protein ligase E3 [Schizosaccharomyces japonicus yFS275]|uniref:E3 ubiquitin-protein ligase listerin n=1 Tax=Schizosaccharomyces japonicus (strain yFS275 / FY16936) TaxID=402676 RepID=B6JXP7_SCHJY|nr:ubiquitin-protein ligase E3 [Schizosaccharomyces japonicus yFS275]EEB05191.1 ubiquitin-protein ligase E3 [Schizosaccharomyces japonicus yFS275]
MSSKKSYLKSGKSSSESLYSQASSYQNEVAGPSVSSIFEPPQLRSLDSDVVIIFKSFQKRDPITRKRALQELLNMKNSDVFENYEFLNAWSVYFPRFAIDEDRSVRQLTFKAMGLISQTLGRKIAPWLRQFMSSWLLGFFDTDRLVSRTARESLLLLFPEEKWDMLYVKFSGIITPFCIEILKYESPETLSDLRFVSVEDSNNKYIRVVCSTISMFRLLVEKLSNDELEKSGVIESLQELLESGLLWDFASAGDSAIKRRVYGLFTALLHHRPDLLEPYCVKFGNESHRMLKNADGLSCIDMLIFLRTTVGQFPLAKTEMLKEHKKRTIQSRLQNLISRKLCSPGTRFYDEFNNLVDALGCDSIIQNLEDFNGFIAAFMEAAEKEQRCFANDVYLHMFDFGKLLYYNCCESTRQFILESNRKNIVNFLRNAWQPHCASTDFIHTMMNTFLNTSKEALVILTDIIDEFFKTYNVTEASFEDLEVTLGLLEAIFLVPYDEEYPHKLLVSFLEIYLNFVFSVLSLEGVGRDRCLLALSRICSFLSTNHVSLDSSHTSLLKFATENLPSLIVMNTSESAFILLRVLLSTLNTENAKHVWSVVLNSILKCPDDNQRVSLLNKLPFILSTKELAHKLDLSPELNQYFQSAVKALTKTDSPDWALIQHIIDSKDILVSDATVKYCFCDIAYFIKSRNFVTNIDALIAMKKIFECFADDLQDLLSEDKSALKTIYILFVETPSDITYAELMEYQNVKRDVLAVLTSATAKNAQLREDIFESAVLFIREWLLVRQRNARDVVDKCIRFLEMFNFSESLSIFAFSSEYWDNFKRVYVPLVASHYFPNTSHLLSWLDLIEMDICTAPLDNHLDTYIRAMSFDLAVLVNSKCNDFPPSYLIFARLVCRVILELGNTSRSRTSMLESFINDFDNYVHSCVRNTSESSVFANLMQKLFDYSSSILDFLKSESVSSSENISMEQIVYAQSLSDFVKVALFNIEYSSDDLETFLQNIGLTKRDNLSKAVLLEMLGDRIHDTKSIERVRFEAANNLAGRLTEANTIQNLIVLTASLPGKAKEKPILPPTRAVVLLQNLFRQVKTDFLGGGSVTEGVLFLAFSCKFISSAPSLPNGLWTEYLDSLRLVLEMSSMQLPGLLSLQFYALRMYSVFLKISEDNEHVQSLLEDSNQVFYECFVQKFFGVTSSPLKNSITMRMCTSLLIKFLRNCPVKLIQKRSYGELCPNVSEGRDVDLQLLALSFLKQKVVSDIEEKTLQLSLNENEEEEVEVPDELLSIIVDHPDDPTEMLRNVDSNESFLRSYLLAWEVAFLFLDRTIYQIKNSITQQIVEMDLLEPLLDFLVELLQLNYTKPVDVSKYSIVSYSLHDYDSAIDRLRSLGTHILYQCLSKMPSVVRASWAGFKNRAFTSVMESFVEKHISPIMVNASLDDVENALQTTNFHSANDTEIKVNRLTREVLFIYRVDEHKLELSIRIPAAYPLRQVRIEGLQRVGVNERQWRAWILASQSMLVSQNGTILDALLLLNKNISLHFEGVEECAICYAVLSMERTLPNKKCATCKHKFHSACLYKWFKSSNASRCPLCRSSFSFA